MKAFAGFGAVVALLAALAAAGCGDVGIMAERYRAEKALYAAKKAEDQSRLSGGRPDSTSLLALRKTYQAVRASSTLPANPPKEGAGAEQYRDLYRTLATAELQGARLAMEARRPDLALEDVEWISAHAGSDTTAARQGDLLMISAYRAVGRYDDAVAKIHEVLAKYPPRSVPNGEDGILLLPETSVEIRERLGDEAGVKKEQAAAVEYFRGILARFPTGELAARIRGHYVRALLTAGDATTALAEAQRLEESVRADPSLSAMAPDVMYVNAKVHAVVDKDHAEAIRLLEKVAEEYPKSKVAGPAMLESAVLLESENKIEQAKERYKEAAARYSRNVDVAPISLFRQAVLEDRTGNWPVAKTLLESIPLQYVGSKASAEAPLAIVQRYARVGDKAAVTASLQKAIETYRQMIRQGASRDAAAVYRWDILKCQVSLKNWEGVYAAVDDLVANHPGYSFTAQALLEGAKAAQANNLKDRAAGYLERFLQDYPNSPVAPKVRDQLKALGG